MARNKKGNIAGPLLVLAILFAYLNPKGVLHIILWVLLAIVVMMLLSYLFFKNKGDAGQSFMPTHDNQKQDCQNVWGTQIGRAGPSGYSSVELPSQTLKHSFSKELLQILDWKRFEELCAAYFEEIGFTARIQHCGPDGGIDIALSWKDSRQIVAIAQCKAWKSDIPVKEIRELFGVMISEGSKEAFFITIGRYTSEAKRFAEDKNITLIDGDELINRINELSPEKKEKLLSLTTWGDYTTPTCASCGTKMKLRDSKHGKFWGCANYPRCKNKLKFKLESVDI